MSSTTVVAHLGVLRVLWTSMSRWSSRSRPPGGRPPSAASRNSALVSEPGMSMWATESPNS